ITTSGSSALETSFGHVLSLYQSMVRALAEPTSVDHQSVPQSTEKIPMKSTKSEFNVEVVKIGEILPHPNADRLDLAKFAGCTVVVKKDEFRAGDPAVHVPVDALVPVEHPAFRFLSSPRI